MTCPELLAGSVAVAEVSQQVAQWDAEGVCYSVPGVEGAACLARFEIDEDGAGQAGQIGKLVVGEVLLGAESGPPAEKANPMPRPHAPFCDLPAGPDHGPFCVSRPVARETVAVTETGERVDVTTDLAVLRTEAGAVASVRVVAEPPEVTGRLVALLSSGAARQLSAALTVAADQADELDRNVRAAMGGHA